jgi:4-amino-4-deoxy-L-arabinose transferase-like glycosyltransferase
LVSRAREGRYFWAAAALLVGCQFAVQLWFFHHYPQPILFGDPAGYFRVGARLRAALFEALRGHPGDALSHVRGALPFAGVGLIYLPFRADHPRAVEALRIVLACSNALGVVGAGVLARRLTGSRLAFFLAVGIAIIHPSFPNHTSRLYPDPVTGCAFVWAAVFYVRGVREGSVRAMFAAGSLLGLGLLIRAQLMRFVLGLLGLALAATFKAWRRQPARGLVVGFLLGVLFVAVPWAGMTLWVDEGFDAKVIEDNFAMRQLYPYGFWQFLETDGFEGPYRLRAEPFYKALEAHFAADPAAMGSPAKQWLFTARYVAQRPVQSALLVLDNVYRLYDRPANPYRWDYPVPVALQVLLHRMIVVLAFAGLALVASERRAFFGVAFVPACISIVHGLSFPWPRYAQPALPTVIGLAAAALVFLGGLLLQEWRVRWTLWPVAVVALSAALLAAGFAFRDAIPAEARGLRLAGVGCLLVFPFLLGARGARGTGGVRNSALGCFVLVLLFAAHAARDHRWHEIEYDLGGSVQAVRQEFELSAEAVAALRRSQSFLVFDLTVPGG